MAEEVKPLEVEIDLDVLTLDDLDLIWNQYLEGKLLYKDEMTLFRRVVVTPLSSIKATQLKQVREAVFQEILRCFRGGDEAAPDDVTKN